MTLWLDDEQREALDDLAGLIELAMSEVVIGVAIERGELTVTAQRAGLIKLMTYLRDDPNCLMKLLIDICGVDRPEREERFEIVYHLLSPSHNHRARVKIKTDAATPVPTLTGLYSTANWFEREVWDMYGVFFADHPDMRRILTDYGFEGHPLRKDFPLTGFVELRYDEREGRVVYEPVQLKQDYRAFDFESPWDGVDADLAEAARAASKD